jgi:hypothetical protein
MYVSWAPGDKVDLDEKLTTLFANDPMYLMGATLYLCGFRFHLYIGDRELSTGSPSAVSRPGARKNISHIAAMYASRSELFIAHLHVLA